MDTLKSGDRGRIEPVAQVSPELISQAIDRIGRLLDMTDYGETVTVGVTLTGMATVTELAYAYMMAAYLIAEKVEVDGMTLRSLRDSIWRGIQDVLWH